MHAFYDSSFVPGPRSIGTYFGHAVPVGVSHVETYMCPRTLVDSIRWRNNDGSTHSMELPEGNDPEPVLVAMRLSL